MLTSLTPSALTRIRSAAVERARAASGAANPGDDLAQRLERHIGGLPPAAQAELLALVWLGNGAGTAADWPALRTHAQTLTDASTPWYLASMVPLDGYIEKGLLALGGP